MELDQILQKIEESDKEIIDFMAGMISIPAIAPEAGGEGEEKRADYIEPFLKDFDTVKRFDYIDPRYPGKKRSSLAAIKKGKKPNTIWILSHIDTVPPGNLDDWKTDPFTLVVKDGDLYGRGTEDDGGPATSSLLAAKQFMSSEFNGYSLGIILAADEEVGSDFGITKLLQTDLFKKGDMFFVPDVSSPTNDSISLSEKIVFWVIGKVTGKAVHGSTPEKGVNPIPVTMDIINDIVTLSKKYDMRDEIFDNPYSTFTPTRFVTAPGGTNAVPGFVDFAVDCRMLPQVNLDDVKKDVEAIMKKYESVKGIRIEHDYRIGTCGLPSATDNPLYIALSDSIESVTGKKVKSKGSSGATCAAYLREKGYDSYCWTMYTGTEHTPNEHTSLKNVKTDAKVMASVIYKLCL